MNTTPEQRQIKANRNRYIFDLARTGKTSEQISEALDRIIVPSTVRGIVRKMRKEKEEKNGKT